MDEETRHIVSLYRDIVCKQMTSIKDEIRKAKNMLIVDMKRISLLIGPDIRLNKKYYDAVFINLKEIFLAEGIDIEIKTSEKDEKFIVLKKMKKYRPIFHFPLSYIPIINLPDENEKEKFRLFLNNNKIFDSKLLACPKCNNYSVIYDDPKIRRTISKWWCDNCKERILYFEYNIHVDDKEKYQIYKLWGLEALNNLMNEPPSRTMRFIGDYFKNCCVSKKKKCVYSDFFEDEDIGNIDAS